MPGKCVHAHFVLREFWPCTISDRQHYVTFTTNSSRYMPRNMLSVAAKKSGMVTPRDVVSMAMVTAFKNITIRMAILKALVCRLR